MKIGVMVESFIPDGFKTGVDVKSFIKGVETAKAMGADGIQKYATHGEIEYNESQIKETLDIVKSNGLVFSAICGDFDVGFEDEERNNSWLIEKSKRVLDLAKKWECDIVTTHIGKIPDEENKTKEIMRKACRELAEYADSIGSCFAVETGTETGKTLFDFLESLGAMGVRANFDPANLVMVVGDRPENAVRDLAKYVVHTHAKDGIKTGEETWLELPLGEGGVNFDLYLPALHDIGYDGFLTIERECGDDPEKDIRMAADFLRDKLKTLGL